MVYSINPPAFEGVSPLKKNVLSMLQTITSSIANLDQRLGSYRSARHLAHVSQIYPKTRTVVFAGSGYFGDNIKYAYLAFCERARQEGVACYFLPYDAAQRAQVAGAGLPCLPHPSSHYSPDEIEILLGTKVLVLDNHFVPQNWRSQTPHALLKGAKSVQLWHGVPLKKLGLETVATGRIDDPGAAEFFASCGPFDVFVAPGTASRADWRRKFSFQSFAALGYPRNDVLFRDISAIDTLNVDLSGLSLVEEAARNGQPVILYTPTFRDHEGSVWFKKAEIAAFADYCAARGYLLCVNLHPAEQDSVEKFRRHYPNVRFVAPHTDIYPIVKHASVFVTDYSSLAFDMLHVDCPLVFYRPDHEDYMARARALIPGREGYTPGEVATDPAALLRANDEAVAAARAPEKDKFRDARHALRKKLFDHHDGLTSQRVTELILKQLDAMKL